MLLYHVKCMATQIYFPFIAFNLFSLVFFFLWLLYIFLQCMVLIAKEWISIQREDSVLLTSYYKSLIMHISALRAGAESLSVWGGPAPRPGPPRSSLLLCAPHTVPHRSSVRDALFIWPVLRALLPSFDIGILLEEHSREWIKHCFYKNRDFGELFRPEETTSLD